MASQAGPTATFDVIGIPHHKAVLYALKIPVTPPSQKVRLRKCTAYEWVEAPSEAQVELLRQAADRAAPPVACRIIRDLPSAWNDCHARAEAVMK